MTHLDKLESQLRRYVFVLIGVSNLLIFGWWLVGTQQFNLSIPWLVFGSITIIVANCFLFTGLAVEYIAQPIRFLWQAILHVSPDHQGTAAPNLEKASLGKELVTNLILQVYQFASTQSPVSNAATRADTVLANFPLPLAVMDKNQTIVYANKLFSSYIGVEANEVTNKNLYSVFDISFSDEQTLDAWLAESRTNTVTATNTWNRVRFRPPGAKTLKQFDMAAYYNKDNSMSAETIITIFDRTNQYGKDDNAMNFVAVAVHELRTPLTVLRGYIEALEEELQGKLDPELTTFMQRLRASAQQLSAFVSNILNVARIDENQLTLQLHEENWANILNGAVADIALRASVHDKHITCHIPADLPSVAVDKVSIYEVIINLLDNAIKYSSNSDKIIVTTTVRQDGMIETTVQDFGIGIPTSIMGNLFERFYRNHRSRASVGGTGLGLYLSKAIVTAHGGQIWVHSKENQGSTFGFSIPQYTKLADSLKNTDNTDITHSAHGWIKNHSFYRK